MENSNADHSAEPLVTTESLNVTLISHEVTCELNVRPLPPELLKEIMKEHRPRRPSEPPQPDKKEP